MSSPWTSDLPPADSPCLKPAPGPPQPDRYMMQLKLGDPLPHDLPADAQRYRLVRKESFRDRGPIGLGIVVALVACGVYLSLLGVADGVLIALGVLVGVAIWWSREVPPVVRYIPDARGDYVVEPHSVTAERLGALAAPERMSTAGRLFAGVAGSAILTLGTLNVRALMVAGTKLDAEMLLPLGIGAWLVFLALRREIPSLTTGEVPPSPLFLELADPSRPLSEDAPISGRSESAKSGGQSERRV